MAIEPERVAAAEVFHHDQTGAVDDAPGLVAIGEGEVERAPLDVAGDFDESDRPEVRQERPEVGGGLPARLLSIESASYAVQVVVTS